jgi:hypothetical protein
MLTTPNPVPPNSTSPLPSDWAMRQLPSFWNLYSAGLTVPPQIACAPNQAAFADLAPAGTMFPVVLANPDQPALSTATLAPAPAPPLSAQVYQTQQSMLQGLTTNNEELGAAVNQAGQAGSPADDYSNAAHVYPMSTTENMILERLPAHLRTKRCGPPRSGGDSPGVPWGGSPVSYSGGGCSPGGLSALAKLFLFAGAGVIALAVLHEHR